MARPSLPLGQSSALRLGLVIAAVFLAANTVAFGVAYFLSAQDLESQAQKHIMEEVASLIEAHRLGGPPALVEEIRIHAATARSGKELFFFSGRVGGDAVGNVIVRQTLHGWGRLSADDLQPLAAVGFSQEYMAFGTTLGDRSLVVAQSTESLDELSEIFARSFLISLLVSTVLALVATAFFVWRAEARINVIARTLDAVSNGAYGQRIPDVDGRPDDLTRIGRSINAMLDRLESNIAGLRQVSADIAHDLKTPLQRLRTTLERLRTDRHDPDAAASVAEDAAGQADTIVRTFQALLRIAQIEGGSPRSRFQPTDLREVCESVAEVFQPAVEDAGHSFTLSVADAEPVTIHGDRDLLAQMLSNLIENAIRHAPPPAHIGVSLSRSGDDAVIEITDTGPGIPVEERERVFRRLYRLEPSRKSEGSGLGLALVAAVVELHEGKVALDDNNPGLRVSVRLPLAGRLPS